MTRTVASLVFAVCACLPLMASAETRLDWDAPAGCPDSSDVHAAIEHWLGAAPTDESLAGIEIEAEVERAQTGYVLELVIRTRSGIGRERLYATDCALFAKLIALKVSLLAAPDQPPPSATFSSAPSERLGGMALRAHAALATSPLPAPAFGFGLGAVYRLALLRLELDAGYLLPRERRYPAQAEVGGTLQALIGGLRGCVSPWVDIELSGCGGFEFGVVRGRGRGIEPAAVTDQLWAALSAGVGLQVPMGRSFGFWLAAAVPWAFVQPEFYVRNLGTLYRSARVGFTTNMGLEWRLP